MSAPRSASAAPAPGTARGAFFRAIPVLSFMMFLAVLMAGVRFESLWSAVASGRLLGATSPAEAAPAAAAPAEAGETPKEAGGKAETGRKEDSSSSPGPAVPRPEEEKTFGEIELVKQLSERRNQLDQRTKALDTREALIRVAEQRVDQKIREMETLRSQLQAMVNQAGAAQQAQIENLVKIYETMKPKEAARIFENLDFPVLLGVVQKMKPQRTAAVMAEMAPEKAREITVALTKQDQLPTIK